MSASGPQVDDTTTRRWVGSSPRSRRYSSRNGSLALSRSKQGSPVTTTSTPDWSGARRSRSAGWAIMTVVAAFDPDGFSISGTGKGSANATGSCLPMLAPWGPRRRGHRSRCRPPLRLAVIARSKEPARACDQGMATASAIEAMSAKPRLKVSGVSSSTVKTIWMRGSASNSSKKSNTHSVVVGPRATTRIVRSNGTVCHHSDFRPMGAAAQWRGRSMNSGIVTDGSHGDEGPLRKDDPLPCDDQAATSEEGSAPPDVDLSRVTQLPEPVSPSNRNRVQDV